MSNNFFDQDFFRYVDPDLFNDYLTQKQLSPIQSPDKKADKAQVMANYLADLYVDDADSVVNDLIVVRQLASDGGVVAIMELSEDQSFKQTLRVFKQHQLSAVLLSASTRLDRTST